MRITARNKEGSIRKYWKEISIKNGKLLNMFTCLLIERKYYSNGRSIVRHWRASVSNR